MSFIDCLTREALARLLTDRNAVGHQEPTGNGYDVCRSLPKMSVSLVTQR